MPCARVNLNFFLTNPRGWGMLNSVNMNTVRLHIKKLSAWIISVVTAVSVGDLSTQINAS
jgi:hypothetical protein